jgi:hypothetical protein
MVLVYLRRCGLRSNTYHLLIALSTILVKPRIDLEFFVCYKVLAVMGRYIVSLPAMKCNKKKDMNKI